MEIGAVISENTTIPASLPRSRPFRLTGSGIGSFAMTDYVSRGRDYLDLIAEEAVSLDARAFPLADVADAWKAPKAPRPVLTTQ